MQATSRCQARMLLGMMGAKSHTIWLSWLLHALVIGLCIALVDALLLHYTLLNGDVIVLFITTLLFLASIVCYIFIYCTIITSPFLALLGVFILWLLSCIIGPELIFENKNYSMEAKVVVAFICPMFCMFYAVNYIVDRDLTDPVNWSTLHKPHENELSILACWIIFITSGVLYFLVVLWLGPMFPGKYGNALGMCWFLVDAHVLFGTYVCTIHCEQKKKEKTGASLRASLRGSQSNLKQELVEGPPPGAHVGIRTVNLTMTYTRKTFRKTTRVVAVKDMTLEIYRDNITVLLGHNGAGKTTTLNLIAGVKMATGGSIYVDGTPISRAAGIVSICPGENVFIPSLTVREHLLLAAKIRGEPKAQFTQLVNTVTAQVGLEHHLEKTIQQLSGGYKRRLSMAIALMNKSKIILLDEPTAGLDPEVRRDVWNIVLQLRKGRTLLITTQFMEEADVLGDRIIIISEGDVLCYGTQTFLRKVYGTGYTLTIQKTKEADGKQIQAVIHNFVPSASNTTETKYTLMFGLPLAAVERFPQLFEDIEERRSELGITTIGLSVSSIEDIFFKSNQYDPGSHKIPEFMEGNCSHVKGMNLLIQRQNVLLGKEMLYLIRSWKSIFFSALFAFSAILATQLLALNIKEDTMVEKSLSLASVEGASALLSGSPPAALDAALRAVVEEAGATFIRVNSFEDMLAAIDKAEVENRTAGHRYAMGFHFEDEKNVRLHYGAWGYHFLPMAINVLDSAMLRRANPTADSISTSVQPLMKSQKRHGSLLVISDMWIMIIPLSLSMWLVIFMNLHVEERVSKLKSLQLMTGVSTVNYWGCRYLVHLSLHCVLAFILTLTLYFADQINLYNHWPEVESFYLLLLAYGMAAIPFAYLLSYSCNNLVTSYVAIIAIFFIGLTFCLIVLVTEAEPRTHEIVQDYEHAMMFSPIYCLISALFHLRKNSFTNHHCDVMFEEDKKLMCAHNPSGLCCTCKGDDCYILKDYFNHDMIKRFIFLFFEGIFFFILILLIDANVFEAIGAKLSLKSYNRREKRRAAWEAKGKVSKIMKVNEFADKERRRREIDAAPLDSDVERERQWTEEDFLAFKKADPHDARLTVTSRFRGDALVVCNLAKAYNSRQLAVRGISFRVRRGECFGLLGLNGAGKSTAFGMLTATYAPSKGDAVADFYSLCSNRKKFAAQIGYCPQVDAYIDCFTGYEHVLIMSLLRGVPKIEIMQENMKWISLLGMEKTVQESVKQYSAGERRKLNTVMAMVGEPPLVFLDEPTSAVDAWSRRKLWDALSVVCKDNLQTVVITSHSMDECEALCDRLAIMSRGQIRCLGDVLHLKQKFRKGFAIRIKVSGEEQQLPGLVARLKGEMAAVFSKGRVTDERPVFLEYRVDDPNLKWSFLFREMQRIKNRNNVVDDYTVSETTLEEIFLSMGDNV